MTYSENGRYTLSGDKIKFVPSEAMFMVKGGAGEVRALTAEEQESMTVEGSFTADSVTATKRWLYPYHTVANEMELVRGES